MSEHHSPSGIYHDQSEPHAKKIALSILITGVCLAAVFVWGSYYYAVSSTEELDAKEAVSGTVELKALRSDEAQKLQGLDGAMKRVVSQYAR